MSIFPLNPESIALEIGTPLEQWPGNCHAIAVAILNRMPIENMRLCRGHYHGRISRRSIYRSGPSQQHSWLVLEDGRILDPTRWAMERPDHPFIYLGENDFYDEAGLILNQRTTAAISGSLFMIGRTKPGAVILDPLSKLDPAQARALFKAADIEISEPFSVHDADRLYSRFSDPVEHHVDPVAFYAAAQDAGLGSLIPLDLKTRILEPEKVAPPRGTNFFYDAPEREEISEMQILFRILSRFLSIEEREMTFESELEELGYGLEEFWDGLNEMGSNLKHDPDLEWMSRDNRSMIAVVAEDLLGKGFGEELRVERYAASLGMDRNALHRAMVRFSDPVGYDMCWLIGKEAERAMRSDTDLVPEI